MLRAQSMHQDTASEPQLRLEGWVLVVALALTVLLPLSDALGRPLALHIPGVAPYVQQLMLWLTFVGGLIAARDGAHLTLSLRDLVGEGKIQKWIAPLAHSVAAAVCAVLAFASVELVRVNRQQGSRLPGGLPEWVSECVIPLGLGLMSARFVWAASPRWRDRAVILALIAALFALGLVPASGAGLSRPSLVLPLASLMCGGTFLGAPVFVGMGGLSLLLFFKDGTPLGAVSAEVYRLISSPTLPAIPLLTAAGYVLAEGQSPVRLVRFFEAWFGWMPGGIAVVVAGVCAPLTTGGSGGTIIAPGGPVLPMLVEAGYAEGFSLGLVTTAGSLGLLFPPSLPVILYAVVASVPVDELYLAGFVPGILLIVLVSLYGVGVGLRMKAGRQPFSLREALKASWGA